MITRIMNWLIAGPLVLFRRQADTQAEQEAWEQPMIEFYDLDTLEEFSKELDFPSRRSSPDALEIEIFEDVFLQFCNLRDAEDNQDRLAGFVGTGWHFHGILSLLVHDDDGQAHVKLDERDVLKGIKSGAILVTEEYLHGTLNDRWLTHKDEKVDFQYMIGQEIRFRRLV